MQIIIIPTNKAGHKQWHLGRASLLVITLLLVSLISGLTYSVLHWLNLPTAPSAPHFVNTDVLSPSVDDVITVNTTQSESFQGFYAQQLGGLQAEAIRLKMLNQRLAEIAGFDVSELDLGLGMGGIERDARLLTSEELDKGIASLSEAFAIQQETMAALQDYLLTNDSIVTAIPTGRPVKEGWISSFYGTRVDPFNGKRVFHDGLDFAGKEGSEVLSAADGIVAWAGMRGGYGGMVEIDHGNGYVTRYAHNKTLKVKAGNRVKKGEVIALMGSTGRSTGPHVHYEILKDGKPVNPYNYADAE
ncbi:M23 family metallopeptidase [Methylophaga frappieri]|uniref:M23 family metallopeptidase n=1 Tax=Methylophaga frappieri (strain ATCC BAA-2434 / DSM 25690 / JAM7) TaxID=754477 RepID=UPI00059E0BD7|nr:M23 family metallopeptidase [Methylophaga frappieri]